MSEFYTAMSRIGCFCHSFINFFGGETVVQVLRQIEVKHVMGSVLAEHQAGKPVNMTGMLQEMGIDNLVRMIFAKPHMGDTECLTREEMGILKGVVKEAVNLAGVIYAGDFIPLLDIYDFTVRSWLQSVSWLLRNGNLILTLES